MIENLINYRNEDKERCNMLLLMLVVSFISQMVNLTLGKELSLVKTRGPAYLKHVPPNVPPIGSLSRTSMAPYGVRPVLSQACAPKCTLLWILIQNFYGPRWG